MLGQIKAVATVPELKAAIDDFFENLKLARTKGQLQIAIDTYKRRLDNLRTRGIIGESQYRNLRLTIPMAADYAWAKKAGEVGTPAEVRAGVAEKTPGEWATEKGYVKEAEESWLKDIALKLLYASPAALALEAASPGVFEWLPDAIAEVFWERVKELAGLLELKIPKWLWLLVGLGALGTAGLFAGGYFLAKLKK